MRSGLSERLGRGMDLATLRRIRRFYLTHPRGTAIMLPEDNRQIRASRYPLHLRTEEELREELEREREEAERTLLLGASESGDGEG